MPTNEEMLHDIYAHAQYLDLKSSDIAGKVLDAPVKLEGGTTGTTTLRAKIGWLAHEQHKVDKVLTNQARIEQKLDQIIAKQNEGA